MSDRSDINWAEPSWGARVRTLLRGRKTLNYATFLDALVELYGERTAFLLDAPIDYPGFRGDVLSYHDIGRLVNKMAGALRSLGVQRGDRVGLITANRVEMGFCNFASAKLGAIPVPMNFMLTPSEIEFIVQRAGIELLVCDPQVFEGSIGDTSRVPSVKRWVMLGAEETPEGITSLAEPMRTADERIEPVGPSSDDEVALLFFTSGTTGFPKGATMSHAATMIRFRTFIPSAALAPRMKQRLTLAVMPVAHAAGYAMLMLNLGLGTPVYLMSRFEPQEILRQIERLRPSIFSGTPAMYRMLLDAGARDTDWTSIRVFGGGADVFDDELIRTMRTLAARRGPLGIRRRPWFIRGYGMAEANSYVVDSLPFPFGDAGVGWIMPPVKARLVDEDGNDVKRGEPGELLLKGPNITRGYWNDPEATAEAITADGWFRTGDVLREGKFRLLYFVGRSSDIIKSGGYKISANEIDQVLRGHPDVEASATVGIPHPVKGERPFSAVVLRPGSSCTPEDVLAWAREHLARYKCPRAIVPIDQVPLTFSMKPKRREVRERLMRELPHEVREG